MLNFHCVGSCSVYSQLVAPSSGDGGTTTVKRQFTLNLNDDFLGGGFQVFLIITC